MTKPFLAKASLAILGLYVGLVGSGVNPAYADTLNPNTSSKTIAIAPQPQAKPPLTEATLMQPGAMVDPAEGTLVSGRILRGAARGAAVGAIGGAIFGRRPGRGAGRGAAIGAAVGGVLSIF